MRKYVPRFVIISLVTLALSFVIYRVAVASVEVADLINSTFSSLLRYILAGLTRLIPFSFFELLIILSPVILALLVFLALRRGTDRVRRVRGMTSLIGVISIVLTSYIYTLGVGYHTTPLGQRIGIEDGSDIATEDLLYATVTVQQELNALAERLSLSDGETRLSYSVDELSERLVSAYDDMLARYPILTNYDSRVKPVYFSTVMSDLQITGIYSFFTGEANVNVEYPDYCVVYTAAHEMAHQRGICRENEANFVAFLVTISSDDDYIRYSGYLNIYEYLISALYRADEDLYYSVNASLHETARADIRAARTVYEKHKDSTIGKINDRLNDAYLKANGTDGIVSYGYVVRLAVGYYKSSN